jgi:hypothetical protein
MLSMDFEVMQQKTRCNWCRNLMIMSEPITDANFILVEGKVLNTGENAYALYCSDCLGKQDRVKHPKAAIDKDTLQEFEIDWLEDDAKQKKEKKSELTGLEVENH